MKKGYLLVAAGAACWGTLGAITTVLFQQGLAPLTVANFRILLTALILGGYLVIFRRKELVLKGSNWILLAGAGLISVCLFNLAYINAIDMTTIVTAVILLYTAPVFVTIISRLLFKEPITLQKLLALILTLVGCCLVVEAYDVTKLKLNATGLLMGLAAGFTYGLYSIFSKKALKDFSPWTTIFYSFVFGTIFISLWGQPWKHIYVFQQPDTAGLLLLLAILPTVLAYILYTSGLQYVETSKAAIIATIEPVVAVILAAAIFKESLNLWQGLGILLVIVSVVLIQIPLNGANKKRSV